MLVLNIAEKLLLDVKHQSINQSKKKKKSFLQKPVEIKDKRSNLIWGKNGSNSNIFFLIG
jgi:hypothetical protein